MYKERILDHYRNPRNKYEMEDSDIKYNGVNPSCGDDITVYIQLSDGEVSSVTFDGKGCAISQASASLLTEEITGDSIEDVLEMSQEDMDDILGIEISPMRVKCEMLALSTVKEALEENHNKQS